MIFTVCKFLTKVVFTLLYRHRVYGVKKNLVKGAAIIASNHNSYLDPIALNLSVRGCLHHLARSTLFSNRFTGWLHKEWGSYPVKRGGGNSAAFKAAFELFKKKKKLIIYPEGERSPTGDLLPGKVGVGLIAIKARVPVVPVYIGGTYDIFNRHQKFPKIWKTVTCVFGTPLTFDDLIDNDTLSAKETYQIATDRIMSKIAELKTWYENGCIGEVP
ncbi:lysophospholipid acyltransferase family protein [Chlamydia caviae]|uniref:1-acyl-sn-glycerol-3-phosphate acyltransferase, putative n=1 Tax=Chlamydia caviae (strain ATCC VR-813 / DSM 19441 / 03DC25 / GPIC) TaxID=227941 RepID=Q824H3_CHLCV|nr:lysophospholipid acyltransferase family protein [Chlamydia caviae]AAP04924.1 1-acyl-sn-glycerol-3-phosphate acyltransferase, putative [Chlamydia caviae GPIC]